MPRFLSTLRGLRPPHDAHSWSQSMSVQSSRGLTFPARSCSITTAIIRLTQPLAQDAGGNGTLNGRTSSSHTTLTWQRGHLLSLRNAQAPWKGFPTEPAASPARCVRQVGPFLTGFMRSAGKGFNTRSIHIRRQTSHHLARRLNLRRANEPLCS